MSYLFNIWLRNNAKKYANKMLTNSHSKNSFNHHSIRHGYYEHSAIILSALELLYERIFAVATKKIKPGSHY